MKITAAKFKQWAENNGINLVDSLNGFKLGDTVTYTNENGVPFENRKIIGIADENYNFYNRRFFLDKDSYWFPVLESELTLTPPDEDESEDSDDLFETPELIPEEVKAILDTWDGDADSYKECDRIETQLLQIGYTVEWGLDGELVNLRKSENSAV